MYISQHYFHHRLCVAPKSAQAGANHKQKCKITRADIGVKVTLNISKCLLLRGQIEY